MSRVLLLLPTATFRTDAFVSAAESLGVDVTVGSEQPNSLAALNPAGLLTLDFEHPQQAARQAVEFAARYPVDAVIPVDDQVVLAGAAICQALGLPHNSLESVSVARDKCRMRNLLRDADVPQPEFEVWHPGVDLADCADRIGFPCVVKPLNLSASQGVIRANDLEQLQTAVARVQRILAAEAQTGPRVHPTVATQNAVDQADSACGPLLIERFVPGVEVALEGMLCDGRLQVLALFDKPDPLDGPYFEETIYVTPSQLPEEQQAEIAARTQQAVQALQLTQGPVHAELRLADHGPVVIEVNARSIGGKCSQVLKFGTGWSLEELIICQALDPQANLPARQSQPAGVMMIPTPATGVLAEIRGLNEAEDVAGVDSVHMVARPGQHLIPLPEGAAYLGFIFAGGESPVEVQQALRTAHERLEFVIEPNPVHRRAAETN